MRPLFGNDFKPAAFSLLDCKHLNHGDAAFVADFELPVVYKPKDRLAPQVKHNPPVLPMLVASQLGQVTFARIPVIITMSHRNVSAHVSIKWQR